MSLLGHADFLVNEGIRDMVERRQSRMGRAAGEISCKNSKDT